MKRFWHWLCTCPPAPKGQPVDRVAVLASIKFPCC